MLSHMSFNIDCSKGNSNSMSTASAVRADLDRVIDKFEVVNIDWVFSFTF